ncbi:hypothetical protein C4D60_Mb08t28610 [Musa balbisiana]|uniref:Uncharacterized protein n=1 Tax=Musa balbisiana TaxID=52838 RepID=A0A4S8K759_MUSBA|nr:hypothetical protein C4D60_Mb08t28610 [Musa balbisiana]
MASVEVVSAPVVEVPTDAQVAPVEAASAPAPPFEVAVVESEDAAAKPTVEEPKDAPAETDPAPAAAVEQVVEEPEADPAVATEAAAEPEEKEAEETAFKPTEEGEQVAEADAVEEDASAYVEVVEAKEAEEEKKSVA